MTCFLSCLGAFTDEIVVDIARAASSLNYFSKSLYREFLSHSFIVPGEGGVYYVHETVRVAALKKTDEALAEEIYRLRLDRLQKRAQNVTKLDITGVLADYVAALVEAPIGYTEFENHLRAITENFVVLCNAGELSLQLQLSEKLFRTTQKKYPASTSELISRTKYGYALCDSGLYHQALEVITAIPVKGDVPANADAAEWLAMQRMAVRVYGVNGMYWEEKNLAERSLELHKQILGEEHPDTWTAMSRLADSYNSLGEKRKALELREQVFEQRRQKLGEDHPGTLAAMGKLANSYGALGEKREALELREQVFEQRKQRLGEDHPDTLAAMGNLANSYSALGEKRKALELREQVYELHKQELGEDHPNTLLAMSNLASSYSVLDENRKALELQEQVFEQRKQKLGEDHPETLKAMKGLANLYSFLGERRKVLELREQVFKQLLQKTGKVHPDALAAMKKLANLYNDLGEKQKALELREQAFKQILQKTGNVHPDTSDAECDRGKLHSILSEKQMSPEFSVRKMWEEFSKQPDTIQKNNPQR